MASKLVVVKEEDDWVNGPNPNEFGQEKGSAFGWTERMFAGYRDGKVFDYSDWAARDLQEMLGKDYKARQIENVLSLPIQSASWTISPSKGDSGESKWLNEFWERDPLNGGCEAPLQHIINQMTSAFAYKKAFFEKVWNVDPLDSKRVIYSDIAWRPQTTCRLMRDPKNGKMLGFEQEAYFQDPMITKDFVVEVKARNAFVYLHGTRLDPLNGISDLEVAYWAWKTKQKILFLWFQFLEGVALPKTYVKANEQGTADQIAGQVSKMKNSSTIGIAAPAGTDSVDIGVIDGSGKGADQFMAAVRWLDQCATNSVLAGFLDLTAAATSSGYSPSGALSKDASDFFLQSEVARGKEITFSARKYLFAPLIRHNFGPSAVIPQFEFEPLHAEDKSDAIAMLTALMGAGDPGAIPSEFVGSLASMVAESWGLDATKVHDQFVQASEAAKKVAAQRSAQMASGVGQRVAAVAGATRAADVLSKSQQRQKAISVG